MRTLNEILERKAYLEWFRHDLVYHFRTTPLSNRKHELASAFYRTLDNEIDMLRWVLGELENTWQDDLRDWVDLYSPVEAEPQTKYPHLPLKANFNTYWGFIPRPVCDYFHGPDSPKDDQNFDFSKVQDPSTWYREYKYGPRPGTTTRFHEPLPGAVGSAYWEGLSGPLWMAYHLGEGPEPKWVNGAWTVV